MRNNVAVGRVDFVGETGTTGFSAGLLRVGLECRDWLVGRGCWYLVLGFFAAWVLNPSIIVVWSETTHERCMSVWLAFEFVLACQWALASLLNRSCGLWAHEVHSLEHRESRIWIENKFMIKRNIEITIYTCRITVNVAVLYQILKSRQTQCYCSPDEGAIFDKWPRRGLSPYTTTTVDRDKRFSLSRTFRKKEKVKTKKSFGSETSFLTHFSQKSSTSFPFPLSFFCSSWDGRQFGQTTLCGGVIMLYPFIWSTTCIAPFSKV